MQAGKTTTCDHLVKNHGYTKVGFKDALVKEMKENVANLLQSLSEHYEMSIDDLFQKKPVLMRKLMQDYGTGIRRRDDEDYWIKLWKEQVVGTNVCVDDVRFKNELKAVRGAGGIIIRIVRKGQENNSTHPSETELLNEHADFTIEAGEGEKDRLYTGIDTILGLLSVRSNED